VEAGEPTANDEADPGPAGRSADNHCAAAGDESPFDRESRPTLYGDRSFWGMVITQFLGAFNDNLFKQLLLLLSIVVIQVTLQQEGRLRGRVEDEKGRRIAGAQVTLLQEGKCVAETSADAQGEFAFPASEGELYRLQSSRGDTAIRAWTSAKAPPEAVGRVTVVSGERQRDLQWIAMFVFALPFLLFSGFAGYLSDRHSKRTVVVWSKVAEIAVMLLGMLAFALRGVVGLSGAMVVLFLMGTQSAFFGPGKYGILPEMLRGRDLPRANGFILMTTFAAIILGQVVGGTFSESLAGRLWMISGVCVVVAVVGTLTSLLIRRVPPAKPQLKLEPSAITVPRDMRRLLWQDRTLLMALGASSMFWLVAGVTNSAVNSVGKIQLQQDDRWTSYLLACVAIGIALGAVVAGLVSRGKANFKVVRIGVWGMLACLFLLSVPGLPGTENPHLLGYTGSLPVLVLLGVFTGMFAIPIQVFLQARPPDGQKGRMIAVMNQANFAAILLAAPVYLVFDQIVVFLEWPRSPIFAFTALLMLPMALFYRPKNEELR